MNPSKRGNKPRAHWFGLYALVLGTSGCAGNDGTIGEPAGESAADGTGLSAEEADKLAADLAAATDALNAATEALNAAVAQAGKAAGNADDAGDDTSPGDDTASDDSTGADAPTDTNTIGSNGSAQAGTGGTDDDTSAAGADSNDTPVDMMPDTPVDMMPDTPVDMMPTEMMTDPLFADPTCTTDTYWTSGENERMRPGEACVACHTAEREGPRFTIAGTLYDTGHEPDRCNGVANGGSADAVVIITDANGDEFELSVNSVGNFTSSRTIAPPYTATVVSSAGERQMFSPQTNGDCNTCHSAEGESGAPGRITVPFQ